MKRRWAWLIGAALLFPWDISAQEAAGVTVYVVQRGDTLFSIAQRHDLTFAEIAQINGLANPNSIDVGDRLLIPLAGQAMPRVHIVQPGETLDAIAGLYGYTVADLLALNQLETPDLYVGLALAIGHAPTALPENPAPTAVAEAPLVDSDEVVMHSVERGETLFRIAQAYGVTVNSVAQANSITNPELIYPGQLLLIPGVRPPQLSAALPAPVTSFTMTPLSLVEGRTGEFSLRTATAATVTGVFLNQTLQFASSGDALHSLALIGVPFGTPPGIYPVTLTVSDATGAQSPVSANIQVNPGQYGVDSVIQVTGDSSLLLNEAVEQQEAEMMRGLMMHFTPDRYFDGPFGLPAAATITSAYGSVRSYNNGALQRVHSGTDFGGPPGAPILASAGGRVVMVDNLNIRGLATVIDHGWGIYTGYWHQSEAYVQPGDLVSEGQVIGAIGSSGRVSGPHLHWELWVNGVAVDPMQWVLQDFS